MISAFKRSFLFTLAVIAVGSTVTVHTTFAQDDAARRIAIGVQAGLLRPANESAFQSRQTLSPTFGVFGLFRNGLGAGISPELNIGFQGNQSKDDQGFIGYQDYKSSVINADVRLRWYPLAQDSKFSPYLSAGVGLLLVTNDKSFEQLVVKPSDLADRIDKAGIGIPITAGFTHNLTDNLGFDLNLGWTLSTTDNINPSQDGTNDGWFAGKVGLMYSFGPIEKDSDGDGLSDNYEINVSKTDPNNPDTDGDNLKDGDEINIHKTDPLNRDTDDGGIDDGVEVKAGTNPLDLSDDFAAVGVGEAIQIRNIEFEVAKSTITGQSERILNVVLSVLNKKSDMTLDIVGHTDNTGDLDFNMKLSNDRAASVKQWLVDKGIDGTRLSTGGLGPNQPIATNDTPEGRRRNRRVEFRRTK